MGEESDSPSVLLARIEVKLDMALKDSADHETRIRSLERWRYALPVALLITLVSTVSTIIQVFTR